MTHDEVTAAMKAEGVDRAMVNEAANRLRLIHWDGEGCGTYGTSACTNCFGPSPMTAHEVAAEVIAAVLPEVRAQAFESGARSYAASDPCCGTYHLHEIENPHTGEAIPTREGEDDL